MFQPNLTFVAALAGVSLMSATAARADFVEPQSWDRGVGGATHQQWETFSGSGPWVAEFAEVNDNGDATLAELTGGASVSGSGNLYNPVFASQFEVTIPEFDLPESTVPPIPEHDIYAVVQIRTQGVELDLTSISLGGDNGAVAASDYAELSRLDIPGFGAVVEHWFFFELDYALFGDGVSGSDADLLTLNFDATGAHMSLDAVSIDTTLSPVALVEPNPVPEPASLALIGLGAMTLVTRRRRSQLA